MTPIRSALKTGSPRSKGYRSIGSGTLVHTGSATVRQLGQGRCETGCVEPGTCRYYCLFERDRDSEGGNLPKSMILDPPVPEELAAIAAGGPVTEPYRATSGLGLDPPRLTNEYGNLVSAGEAFRTGLTLLGQAAALLPVVIEAFIALKYRTLALGFVGYQAGDRRLLDEALIEGRRALSVFQRTSEPKRNVAGAEPRGHINSKYTAAAAALILPPPLMFAIGPPIFVVSSDPRNPAVLREPHTEEPVWRAAGCRAV
jgi:hypothetical protein